MYMNGKAFWCPPMAPYCTAMLYALFKPDCTSFWTKITSCVAHFAVQCCTAFCRRWWFITGIINMLTFPLEICYAKSKAGHHNCGLLCTMKQWLTMQARNALFFAYCCTRCDCHTHLRIADCKLQNCMCLAKCHFQICFLLFLVNIGRSVAGWHEIQYLATGTARCVCERMDAWRDSVRGRSQEVGRMGAFLFRRRESSWVSTAGGWAQGSTQSETQAQAKDYGTIGYQSCAGLWFSIFQGLG